jgi:hypothetical protein
MEYAMPMPIASPMPAWRALDTACSPAETQIEAPPERCGALLDEIGREGVAGKYTFAEMEESEQDLEKLVRWLAKIQARDFFPDERGQEAAAMLVRCQTAVMVFSQAVYAAENVTTSGARGPQASGEADPGQLDSIQPV